MKLENSIFKEKTFELGLLLTLSVVHIICRDYNQPKLIFFVLFFGGLNFLFRYKKEDVLYSLNIWVPIFLIFLIELVSNYYREGNHLFVLIYLSLLIILQVKVFKNTEILSSNIRYLLSIIMIFSVVQKILSEEFISGNYFYYMMNVGAFFKPILTFNQEITETIETNRNNIMLLEQVDPNKLNSASLLNVIPNLKIVSITFAWLVVISEALLATLLVLKPKHNLTHVLFIGFIIGTFITRLEVGFLSILTVSALFLVRAYSFKVIYTGLTLFFLSLLIVKIGFY